MQRPLPFSRGRDRKKSMIIDSQVVRRGMKRVSGCTGKGMGMLGGDRVEFDLGPSV